MRTLRELKIGYFANEELFSYRNSIEKIVSYLSHKSHYTGRLTLALADYLVKYSKKFDRVSFVLTDEPSRNFPNGTKTGLARYLIQSKVDIATQLYNINEENYEMWDFTYPYTLSHSTFLTETPEYKPQIFGIFQTLPFSILIAILLAFIALCIVYYAIWKRKYSFDKILLHVFAVFLRQNSVVRPSSRAENMLVYSWVVGAMFLCLAYDSVFLSFLSIPPVTKVNDASQLAKAIVNEEYHAITIPNSAIPELML